MDEGKLRAWIVKQIQSFAPDASMVSGDISLRFPRIMEARRDIERGSAFGYTFPEAIREQGVRDGKLLLDEAVNQWRTYLSDVHGEEGKAFFERAAVRYELQSLPARAPRGDAELSASLRELVKMLDDVDAMRAYWLASGRLDEEEEDAELPGFFLQPARADVGELLARYEHDGGELPAEVEALYSELDSLWVGFCDPPGGRQEEDPNDGSYVFAPLERVLERSDDIDGCLILSDDPDAFRWTLYRVEDGGVYERCKLDDGPPKLVASSLKEYVKLLAKTYGIGR